jgi:hypothetical protein
MEMNDTVEQTPRIFGDLFFELATFQWGLQTFISIGLIAFFAAIISLLTVVRTTRQLGETSSVLGALFVVGLFGGLVGFHGGNSRVGVVGDLIPAVVTLVAGMAAYLFGLPKHKPGPYLFPLLGAFIATLFISWSIGSANNAGNEQWARHEAQCLQVFSQHEVLASEIALQNAREEFSMCSGVFQAAETP